MQKKVLALAVAGLVSGAAFAQSNVTVYGVVDAGFVNSSGGRTTSAGGQANWSGIESGLLAGSRVGFKGEEGLGNGLKAIFTLEYYVSPDANNVLGTANAGTQAGGSGSATRQSFVGLQHAKYGTLSLGRQYAFGYGSQVRNDAWGGAAVGALATANGAAQSTFVAGSNARLSNSVVYATPNWSGFSAVAGYAYGEANATATGAGAASNGFGQGTNGVFTTGVNYANGPLNLDLGYQTRQNRNAGIIATVAGQSTASAGTGDSINEWMVGGSYDFKVVKVFATYQDQNDNNGTSAQEASNSQWSVGASVPVFGNGKIIGSYAKLDWDRTGAGSSYVYALGYTHALSKRTTLYTAYNYANNDRTVVNSAGMVGATRFQGESNSTVTAGISHAF